MTKAIGFTDGSLARPRSAHCWIDTPSRGWNHRGLADNWPILRRNTRLRHRAHRAGIGRARPHRRHGRQRRDHDRGGTAAAGGRLERHSSGGSPCPMPCAGVDVFTWRHGKIRPVGCGRVPRGVTGLSGPLPRTDHLAPRRPRSSCVCKGRGLARLRLQRHGVRYALGPCTNELHFIAPLGVEFRQPARRRRGVRVQSSAGASVLVSGAVGLASPNAISSLSATGHRGGAERAQLRTFARKETSHVC